MIRTLEKSQRVDALSGCVATADIQPPRHKHSFLAASRSKTLSRALIDQYSAFITTLAARLYRRQSYQFDWQICYRLESKPLPELWLRFLRLLLHYQKEITIQTTRAATLRDSLTDLVTRGKQSACSYAMLGFEGVHCQPGKRHQIHQPRRPGRRQASSMDGQATRTFLHLERL
jgi:hypothetical protein